MKDGIAHTLRELHHGERQLARDLVAVAERHAEEHEVHHVATDLADWSRDHADRLVEYAAAEGLRLDDDTPEPASGEGEGEDRRGCCSCTICGPCTWPPRRTPCTGRCSRRPPRRPGTNGCWCWRRRVIRRRCGRCAGPTP